MAICRFVTWIWLMIICISIVRGKIQWKVERKVTGYGQDLVLFCEVENCCSEHAGWSVDNIPIYLDVKHFIEIDKYDADINRTGFTLMIKMLTKNDLNRTYVCSHGFEDSKPKVLEHNDAFLRPAEEGGKEENKLPLIIGVCVGVIVVVIVTSIVGYSMWKRRRGKGRRRNNDKYHGVSTKDNDEIEMENSRKGTSSEDKKELLSQGTSSEDKKELLSQGKSSEDKKELLSQGTSSEDKKELVSQGTSSEDKKELSSQAFGQLSETDEESGTETGETGDNITIVIVGENRIGKTCLLHRLLGKSIEDIKSTDRTYSRNCKIRVPSGHLVHDKDDKKQTNGEVLVDFIFWDFPAQKHYHPTHQIFLNTHTVCLLVVDIMKDIKQINTEVGYDKIGEYIDFWLDSIHSCRSDKASQDSSGVYLNPPVIIVCTGIDKCSSEQLDERKNEFRKQVYSLLDNEDKLKHLRHICYVSNLNSSDEELIHLRQSIIKFGTNRNTSVQKLPLEWIRLKQALDNHISSGVNILSLSDIDNMALTCSVKSENEVSEFLQYHHEIGSIIYFKSLKPHIIINPKWITDAFRCFKSYEFDNKLHTTREWVTLKETGQLEPSLIENLLQKNPERNFYQKHKEHLLDVMDMFGFIIKLDASHKYGKLSPTYFMPCMISQKPSIKRIYDEFDDKNIRTPWLCIQFDFMPIDFFNRIFCHYIRKYAICTLHSGRQALYHGMGVFRYGMTRFILCFSKNTIGMQIWQLKESNCKFMLDELKEVIDNLKGKYERGRFSYIVKSKCAIGDIHINAGRYSYEELKELGDTFKCDEHEEMLQTSYFIKTWFEEKT